MKEKDIGIYNLRIHYIWTFFSSILFLGPVITLYYKFNGLNASDIILLTSIYYIFSFLLDIPTSTLGDIYSRSRILLYSVISSFVPIIIYVFFPFKILFFVAVFFGSLGQALWSGTGHAKLQEDLESAGMKKDFGKVIGRLIAIQRFGTLLTPIVIYFVLKYFPNFGYTILAFLDFLVRVFVIYWVSRFKDISANYRKIAFIKDFKEHIDVLRSSISYISKNKIIIYFMLMSIFIHNSSFFQTMTLPILSDFGIHDYFGSMFVWIYSFALIFGSVFSYKLASKIGNNKTLGMIIFIFFVLHLLYYFFAYNLIIFACIILFLNLFIGFYSSLRNHILMDLSDISNKATFRSIILSIIFSYQGLMFWIFSKISFDSTSLILSVQFFIGFIIYILFVRQYRLGLTS